LPGVAVEETVKVATAEPAPGAGIVAVLRPTETPLGWPVMESPMDELNPPEIAVVIVEVAEFPTWMEREAGEAEIVNAAVVGLETVSDREAVWVMPPPVPVTVIE
jgi:hypothetical protein